MPSIPKRFNITVSTETSPSSSGPEKGREKYVAESKECSIRVEGNTISSVLASFGRRVETSAGSSSAAATAPSSSSSASAPKSTSEPWRPADRPATKPPTNPNP